MGLIDSLDTASSGLDTHSQRIEIHAKNIANIDTPNYVRKIPVLTAQEDISFNGLLNRMKEDVFKSGTLPAKTGGVHMTGIIEDPTEGQKIYAPGHPDADQNGYIRRSNVNPLTEMADLTLSARAYEANIEVVGIVRTMTQKATDIGK